MQQCREEVIGVLPGVATASFLGGMRSFTLSRPWKIRKHDLFNRPDLHRSLNTLASANEVILWLGENPCSALFSDALPPERAPRGSAPVGVRPFSCNTDSDSSL